MLPDSSCLKCSNQSDVISREWFTWERFHLVAEICTYFTSPILVNFLFLLQMLEKSIYKERLF